MKKKFFALLLALAMSFGLLPAAAFADPGEGAETTPDPAPVAAGTEYTVSPDSDWSTVIESIKNGGEETATIVLTADISNADAPFVGVEGVHITLKSSGNEKYSIHLGKSFAGPVTLDNIEGDWGTGTYNNPNRVFANGYEFVTTEDFAVKNSSYLHLFGGGDSTTNVTTGTNLVLSGGKFCTIFGGGYRSSVTGNTSITISGAEFSGIVGGGYGEADNEGTVNGDTYALFHTAEHPPASRQSRAGRFPMEPTSSAGAGISPIPGTKKLKPPKKYCAPRTKVLYYRQKTKKVRQHGRVGALPCLRR